MKIPSKPDYYVINGNDVIATVFIMDNQSRVVFIRNPEINIEFGLKFLNVLGTIIVDDEVAKIFEGFLLRGSNDYT